MIWPEKNLGEICEFIRGPFGGSLKKEIFIKEGFAVYEQQHAIYNQFNSVRYFIDSAKFNELKRFELCCGDLIMSCSGTFGKVAVAPLSLKRGIINQALLKITPSKKIDVNYLKHFMESNSFQSMLMNETHGAAIKNVASVAVLKKIKIPFPPLAEQQRIADLLDTASFTLKLRELAIAKLDQLAQSVFVDMFSNCTNFESMKSVVLKKKISQPHVNQHVWSLSLDQIESDTGNLQNKVMVEFKKLGSSTYFFEPPVILYSKLRPYLNKVFMPTDCGYATTELVPLYCNDKKVLPIYLLAVLRSKKFVEFANTNSGGAKMPRVIMDKFWDYEFAVPSIQQQQKYANFYMSILNQKRHCLNAYTLNQALLSSLQHQSFAVN